LPETISKSQEGARQQVPRELLLGTISGTEDAVHDYIHDLVFSLDEIGLSE
jgi:hypothetical protein